MSTARYPEAESPFRARLVERYRRFAELREEFLLDFKPNTARAYWGDLEHLLDWSLQRQLDILRLSESDIKRYLTWLKRRKYSQNTIRRRMTSFRSFYALVAASGETDESPITYNRSASGFRGIGSGPLPSGRTKKG